ncbi:DMT family transporter [Frigidibacter oleivorans]|uniref:DMT family transporter n=1 Tax=Frigidibacter oleivorans TaxID=2487129 RepID=UPI0013DFD9F5|nr:DMT family transporter [Frigidibacter oleivorans]
MSRTAETAPLPMADRVLAGVGLMIAFCIVAPLIDVSAKSAVQAVPVATVTFARFVVQGALMLPIVLAMGLPMRLSPIALRLLLLRAAALVCSTFSFVAAVQSMPIADALAIAFVEPFVILLIGRLVLAEQVGWRRMAASVVGFAGALLVIQPSFAAFGAVALFPLGTAVSFAIYMLVTRRLSREMHAVTMQLHTALAAALLCLPLFAAGAGLDLGALRLALPQTTDIWLWCAGTGAAATVAHMAITYALQFAPSATLAPLHYLEIVTATLFGYLFFGDFPGGMTWTGIGVIVASGLYIIHRERQMQGRLVPPPDAPR